MNMVGAIGLALLGVALFFNKLGEQPAGVLIAIVVMYALLVAVPVVSMRALSAESSQRVRTFAIFANWFVIGLWLIGFLGAVYNHVGIVQSIGGALMLVLPQTINIRTLRRLNRDRTAENRVPLQEART
nr:MAG: hypothetical protein DIU57_15890 [Pseudomonadota bacterium]